jgi:hypothetical protein
MIIYIYIYIFFILRAVFWLNIKDVYVALQQVYCQPVSPEDTQMTGFNYSTEAWLDAQKQYLNLWMQMSKQGMGWTGSQSPLSRSGDSVPGVRPVPGPSPCSSVCKSFSDQPRIRPLVWHSTIAWHHKFATVFYELRAGRLNSGYWPCRPQ